MAENPPTPAHVLAQYRRWKEDGEALRAQAQGLLVERFHDLMREAQQLQQDLWNDFGQSIKFPANPKFVRKGKGRAPVRKLSQANPASRVNPSAQANPPQSSSKVDSLPAPSALRGALAVAATAPAVDRKPQPAAGMPATTARKPMAAAPLRAPNSTKAPTPDSSGDPQKKRRQLLRLIQKAEEKLQQLRPLGDAAKIQNAEDRLYELNDDLRLLDEAV
ncbi:MAG: hypothetical protein MUF01_14865 [Bryobacterales bacterium]|jgi:hypothetical protein|nr:hypothetical protein [Bryobacterales bacterium]